MTRNHNDLHRTASALIDEQERQRLEQFRNWMRLINWRKKGGPELAAIERERAAVSNLERRLVAAGSVA